MSTPAGNLQQSSSATYNQAIQSLRNADTQMAQVQAQVDEAKATLQSNYGGSDGQAYAQVMTSWLQEVDRIRNTCEAMENQLFTSMGSANKAQGMSIDEISAQGKLSATAEGAFNGLVG
jgi:uncharacterized protein YukE